MKLKSKSSYFARIGRKGGLKSRRRLDSDTARQMVLLREARRAFKIFHAQCFWSFDPNYVVGPGDISWVAEQLKKHGNRELWLKGKSLCR